MRLVIVGSLMLTSLSYSANFTANVVPQELTKDQDSIYKERKTWIGVRKSELFKLCDQLINSRDFPKTNIETQREKFKLKVRMYEKEIESADYANDKTFAGIQKKFDYMESSFRSTVVKLKEKEDLKW